MKPLLVFDMDGVLVDVTESYREAISQTAAYFVGAAIPNERIQEYKNRGGFNDDWELTHRIIQDSGVEADFEAVKRRFQLLFLGERSGADPLVCGRPPGRPLGPGQVCEPTAGPGGPAQTRGSAPLAPEALIMRERWIARPGTLEKLGARFRFAVFTGRPREEAGITLARFAGGLNFDPVIAMEDVRNHKPHSEGLLRALELAGCRQDCAFYIGDSVDDARCARAAGVPFLGIAGPSNPRYLDLVFLFQAEKAYAIVDDINFLEEALA